MHRFLFLILFSLCLGAAFKAQTIDTIGHQNKKDSLNHQRDPVTSKAFKPKIKKEHVDHPDSTHSPHTAWVRSAIFPGLGQIYNGKGLWWRLPAIYGGLGLIMDAIIFNQKSYSKFLAESEYRAHGRIGTDPYPDVSQASDQEIYDFKDLQRRDRDLCIIVFVAAWGVNVADAYVEAKFIHSYTMDNNLSFKITPSIITQPVYASNFNTFTPVLKLTLTF